MKGVTGTNCGTIIYTRQLKKTTKNCRNCNNSKSGEFGNSVYCKEFKINISDCNNAKVCSKYKNKNERSKLKKTSNKKKSNNNKK